MGQKNQSAEVAQENQPVNNSVRNAQIYLTQLGFEGHGIFSYMLYLNYGGANQGFGGFVLTGDYCSETIKGILNAVGVENWEDLKGKFIRAELEDIGNGFNRRIKRIGNIIEDKWFDPTELAEKMDMNKVS